MLLWLLRVAYAVLLIDDTWQRSKCDRVALQASENGAIASRDSRR